MASSGSGPRSGASSPGGGLVAAFLISAVVMAAGAVTLWFWPFQQIADMDRSLVRWPEPQLPISADRGSGLVLVRTTYSIAAEKERQFLASEDCRRPGLLARDPSYSAGRSCACASVDVKRGASLGRGNSRTCPWNGRQS